MVLLGQVAQGLSACVFYLLYFFVSEAMFATTIGKKYFGLSIMCVDGGKCGVRHASVRTILRIVEANPILLGGIPVAALILVSSRKQRLGGMCSHTVVVDTR